MMKPILISLNTGDRVYINGAVVRATRKVTLEILNEATFLLQQHVMQVEQAVTPSRQMYFVMQTILMDPKNAASVRLLLSSSISNLMKAYNHPQAIAILRTVADLAARDRILEAMKSARGLFAIEDEILGRATGELGKLTQCERPAMVAAQ
jgi:flagellar biosynthesis repressor protein FlbT